MRTNNNNRGILRIDTGENNLFKVIFQPAGDTVWLRKEELASLFHVNIQVINAKLDTVFTENTVDVEKSCKYKLYAGGNRIRYDVREVNLEVVIAMAFRIASPNARILREWFIRRCIYGVDNIPLPEIQNFHLN
jgi:hypothetical protein